MATAMHTQHTLNKAVMSNLLTDMHVFMFVPMKESGRSVVDSIQSCWVIEMICQNNAVMSQVGSYKHKDILQSDVYQVKLEFRSLEIAITCYAPKVLRWEFWTNVGASILGM